MKRVTVCVVAPHKLRSLCGELSKVKDYCGTSIYIQAVDCGADITTIKEQLSCDCLLVFDTAAEAISMDRAYEKLLQVLKQIRLQQPQLRVVVALGKATEMNIHLINELIKIGIYNVYFVDGFNLDDVVSWMLGPEKGLGDVEQYITQTITQKVEQKIVERIVEVPVEVPVPVPIKEKEKRRPLRLPFFGGRTSGDKPMPAAGRRACLVGVVGAGYGVGVTSLCVRLAKDLAAEGRRTACLERNSSRQLAVWPERRNALKGVDFYEEQPLHEVPWRVYDYLFIDFGVYIELSPGGEYVQRVLDDAGHIRQTELALCERVILCCSPAPWRRVEAAWYMGEGAGVQQTADWIFYMPGAGEPPDCCNAVITGSAEVAYTNLRHLLEQKEEIC